MPSGYMVLKLFADGAEKTLTSISPNSFPESMDVITWPTRAGNDKKAVAKITGITTGKIVDFGIKDSMNMGAAMAPAACDLIYRHFEDFSSKPEDYDAIITGDLGTVGAEILVDLLKEKGQESIKKFFDFVVHSIENNIFHLIFPSNPT